MDIDTSASPDLLTAKKKEMNTVEIKNGIIQRATIDMGDRDLLTAWLFVDHDGGTQGFGGYSLYLPKSYKHFTEKGDFAGHFIYRCMQIAGVEDWKNITGKAIRIKGNRGGIEAIGHIVKDDWFYPSEDFKKMSGEK